MESKTIVTIIGLILIGANLIVAQLKGVDGTLLTAGVGSIAAIVGGFVGFTIGKTKETE